MTTADMVAGSGYRTLGLDSNNDSYDYGYLSGDIPPPCLAENCMSYTQLNLAQLMYGDFGTQIGLYAFNPSDTRGLVYIRGTSSPGYPGGPGPVGAEQSFYVSAVPLPGAVWLFGSGLLGLLGVSRRRKAS
jgi:hypothetical protein